MRCIRQTVGNCIQVTAVARYHVNPFPRFQPHLDALVVDDIKIVATLCNVHNFIVRDIFHLCIIFIAVFCRVDMCGKGLNEYIRDMNTAPSTDKM